MLSWGAAARAQEAQIGRLAHDSAGALIQARKRHVVVLDFTGNDAIATLGEKLAADFRVALARESRNEFKVEDRAATVDRATEKSVTLANLRDPATLGWIYSESGVDSWISGELTEDSVGVKLDVRIHPLASPSLIAEFTAEIPLLPDLKALIVAPPADTEFASLPTNGAPGLTKAVCVACPQAVYSTEALRAHAQGTVILAFTIDKHGRTKEVRVKQAMPDGLTQRAIDAVLGWKFTPAKDARGKKVEVRQTTAVEFHQL